MTVRNPQDTDQRYQLAEGPVWERRLDDGKCDPQGRFLIGTLLSSHLQPLIPNERDEHT